MASKPLSISHPDATTRTQLLALAVLDRVAALPFRTGHPPSTRHSVLLPPTP